MKYGNFGGNSGVSAYEIGNDWIIVTFSSGAKYKYTEASCGLMNISELKRLAAAGQGLNSYINRRCRDCGRKL